MFGLLWGGFDSGGSSFHPPSPVAVPFTGKRNGVFCIGNTVFILPFCVASRCRLHCPVCDCLTSVRVVSSASRAPFFLGFLILNVMSMVGSWMRALRFCCYSPLFFSFLPRVFYLSLQSIAAADGVSFRADSAPANGQAIALGCRGSNTSVVRLYTPPPPRSNNSPPNTDGSRQHPATGNALSHPGPERSRPPVTRRVRGLRRRRSRHRCPLRFLRSRRCCWCRCAPPVDVVAAAVEVRLPRSTDTSICGHRTHPNQHTAAHTHGRAKRWTRSSHTGGCWRVWLHGVCVPGVSGKSEFTPRFGFSLLGRCPPPAVTPRRADDAQLLLANFSDCRRCG